MEWRDGIKNTAEHYGKWRAWWKESEEVGECYVRIANKDIHKDERQNGKDDDNRGVGVCVFGAWANDTNKNTKGRKEIISTNE